MESNQVTPQSLAHELNSLLDGALRWLALAQESASQQPDGPVDVSETLGQRHDAARQALLKMAELLARAQSTGQLDVQTLRSSRTIEQELQHVLSLVEPQCRSHGVELLHDLDHRAACLPAGVLAPIMINGLRNAIESCSHPGLSTRRVSISIALHGPDRLQVLIEDTGTGLPQSLVIGQTTKANGHGLGLSLCRSLVEQCGGVMELANVPYGGGAVLSVILNPLHPIHDGVEAA